MKRPMMMSAVDWSDAADIRLWIVALRVQVQDLAAAGDDATRHPKKRILSRAESRRRVLLADRAAEALLAAGEKSLPAAM